MGNATGKTDSTSTSGTPAANIGAKMKYKRTITIYSNEPIKSCDLPYKNIKIVDEKAPEKTSSCYPCKLQKKGPKILIFQREEYVIGGIETWGYNLAKTFKDKDITFVFQSADREQVERLSTYANVVIDDGKLEYECDIFISANYDGNCAILDRVKAKKYYQTIHSNFALLKKLPYWDKFELNIDKRYQIIAVSEDAKNGLAELGYDSRVAVNPLAPVEQRPLVLLSMTRVTIEKGAKRILKIAKELKRKNIKFIWILASTINNTDEPEIVEQIKNMPEFVIIPPSIRNEPLYWIADATVQLSDTEAYCYSIRQSLMCGTPVIATKFEAAKQIVKDGKNGILLDMDLSNLDVEKIAKTIPKMKPIEPYYEPPDPEWERILTL